MIAIWNEKSYISAITMSFIYNLSSFKKNSQGNYSENLVIKFLFLDEKAEGWDVAQIVAMLCEYFGIRRLKFIDFFPLPHSYIFW